MARVTIFFLHAHKSIHRPLHFSDLFPLPTVFVSDIKISYVGRRLIILLASAMADLRDEHGNPIQLTDQHGNPVQLTDEYGNPMHLTGIASTHPIITTTPIMQDVDALKASIESTPPAPAGHMTADQPFHGGAPVSSEPAAAAGVGEVHHEKHESSSSSSSSEDDGQGGRRKKGLKEKIKEKLTGGKHKEEEKEQAAGHAPPTTTGTATTNTATTEHHHEPHEKKGMLEKIKEKLPGHHHSSH